MPRQSSVRRSRPEQVWRRHLHADHVGDVPTLVSAVGGPISATPFVATFSGILFRDADDVAFLTDAVVSE